MPPVTLVNATSPVPGFHKKTDPHVCTVCVMFVSVSPMGVPLRSQGEQALKGYW